MKLVDPCGCFPTGKHYPGIAHLIRVRVVGVADELDPDAPWRDSPVAFIDTETTGVDSKVDRIIEFGVVIGCRGAVEARHSWLINPTVPIPKESSEVHGITDADVKDMPRFGDVVDEIVDALRGTIPAAYNASFDRGFLHEEIERCAYRAVEPPPAVRDEVAWIDPLVFAREMHKGQGESRALGAVAERLGVTHERAHRATDDAEAGLMVMYKLAEDARVPKTYAALIQEQRRLERQQAEAQRFWRR